MALPGITAPPGTPTFLAIGHEIEEDSVFATVAYSTGHSRTRRRQTVTERVVSVHWQLNPDQMRDVDSWFKLTLKNGALSFAAYVKDEITAGMAWWEAKWITAPQWDMQHLGRGRANGQLLLLGEGSSAAPDTSTLGAGYRVPLLSGSGVVAGNSILGAGYFVALLSIEGT